MTWFRVSVPAKSTWDFRVESPDGEDFDLMHNGRFHDTGERADIVKLVNATDRTKTEIVGVYLHADANDANVVNRNIEGDSKPPVVLSFAEEMPAGLALAQEWDALNEAGAEAANVAGEFDAEITAFTAPQRQNAGDALVWTQTAVTPGTRQAVNDKRYFQWRLHVKKSRNRAIKTTALTFLELT